MVINNVHIDIKNNLLICSTDAGITLYSLTANEITKISEYKIMEGCRLCRLIKSKNSVNTMNAVYLPKSSDTIFCTLDITLPSYTGNHNNNNNNNNNACDDMNDVVANYHTDTPVTKNYVTGRFDLKKKIYNIHLTLDKIIIVHDREIIVLGKNNYTITSTINTHLNTADGIALISSKEEEYLIYTLGARCGEVVIVSPSTNDYTAYKCHEHEIQCIATDINEKYMATASVNGTIINVYDLTTGQMIFKFRRGSSSAKIWNIAISDDLKWLACCSYSTKGTLHIFELDPETQVGLQGMGVGGAIMNHHNIPKKVENGKTFFSRMFKDYAEMYFAEDSIVNATWSAIQHSLNSPVYHTCKFDKLGNIHVVSLDGKYFKVLGGDYNYKEMMPIKNLCVIG
jgi:WD40 repeat protein